jgi:prevent-host-death family protein
MTKSVNVHEAKTHLSRLLDEAQAGEEIIICKAGVPVARLVPVHRRPRPSGVMRGIWPDFDEDHPFFLPLPDEELRAWEG